ncbi:MAG: flagellar biosynthesis protein FlhB [Alphaproteobacteria bacterium]|nr:flagellar biosynthesis protein FlhB [Alphaproteobacteria bacterium]
MAEDDDQESKTEDPTGKRISDAQGKGNFPMSNEIKQWVTLIGSVAFLAALAPLVMRQTADLMLPLIAAPHEIPTDPAALGRLLTRILARLGLILLLPFLLFMIMAVLGTVIQIGWVANFSLIKFSFDKMNLFAGLKRMVSFHTVLELVKSIAKVAVVGGISALVIMPRIDDLPLLMDLTLLGILDYLQETVFELTASVAAFVTVIAVGDLAWQRYTYFKRLRMTKQEVKDENKNTEGDPMVKGRIRSLRLQKARERMMASVPKADVVVTNPTHYACALKYDMETMGAPILVAKGIDHLAKRIREVAEENEVPIVENPPLARALYASVDIDREVPPEHYKAVAEVIGYVMRLKGKLRG